LLFFCVTPALKIKEGVKATRGVKGGKARKTKINAEKVTKAQLPESNKRQKKTDALHITETAQGKHEAIRARHPVGSRVSLATIDLGCEAGCEMGEASKGLAQLVKVPVADVLLGIWTFVLQVHLLNIDRLISFAGAHARCVETSDPRSTEPAAIRP
jgi:hypothetical protein